MHCCIKKDSLFFEVSLLDAKKIKSDKEEIICSTSWWDLVGILSQTAVKPPTSLQGKQNRLFEHLRTILRREPGLLRCGFPIEFELPERAVRL